MNLVITAIIFLEISYVLCRHVPLQHNNDNLHSVKKPLGGMDKFGHIEKTLYNELFDIDLDKKAIAKLHDSTNFIQRFSTKSGKEVGVKRQKRHVQVTDNENFTEMDRELDNEITSYLLTNNNNVDELAMRDMATFYFDMINLLQYELKEIGERGGNVREHRRKPRKSRRLRPKRSLRSLLKDTHIKNILRKYFQQKQNQENGNPLLRYG